MTSLEAGRNPITEANWILLIKEAKEYIESPLISTDVQARVVERMMKIQVDLRLKLIELKQRVDELERQNRKEKR